MSGKAVELRTSPLAGTSLYVLPAEPARVGWTAVAVLLVLYALAIVDRQILSLLVQPIRSSLGISDFQISLLQGLAFSIMFCVFGLVLGYAVDRFSRRLVVFAGVLIWACATIACGVSHSFWQLFVARIFVGVGEAALAPAAYSMLSDLFHRERLTFALSVYSIGALLGNVVALVLSGVAITFAQSAEGAALFGHLAPWQIVFVLVGLPGIAGSFLIFLVPEPKRTGTGSVRWSELFALMRRERRFFALHFAAFSCIGVMAYSNMAWLPSFLSRTYHLSIPTTAAYLAIYYSVTPLVFLSSGKAVDVLARRGYTDSHLRYYVVVMPVAIIAGVVSFIAPTPLIFFILFGTASFAVSVAAIAPAALQIVAPPQLRGRLTSVYLLVTGLVGMTCGPGFTAALTDFVFRDPSRINNSLQVIYAIFGMLALLMFCLCLAPMRQAFANARRLDAPAA